MSLASPTITSPHMGRISIYNPDPITMLEIGSDGNVDVGAMMVQKASGIASAWGAAVDTAKFVGIADFALGSALSASVKSRGISLVPTDVDRTIQQPIITEIIAPILKASGTAFARGTLVKPTDAYTVATAATAASSVGRVASTTAVAGTRMLVHFVANLKM